MKTRDRRIRAAWSPPVMGRRDRGGGKSNTASRASFRSPRGFTGVHPGVCNPLVKEERGKKGGKKKARKQARDTPVQRPPTAPFRPFSCCTELGGPWPSGGKKKKEGEGKKTSPPRGGPRFFAYHPGPRPEGGKKKKKRGARFPQRITRGPARPPAVALVTVEPHRGKKKKKRKMGEKWAGDQGALPCAPVLR